MQIQHMKLMNMNMLKNAIYDETDEKWWTWKHKWWNNANNDNDENDEDDKDDEDDDNDAMTNINKIRKNWKLMRMIGMQQHIENAEMITEYSKKT